MIYTAQYKSPVGKILLAAENEALVGLWIEGQKYFPDKLPENAAKDSGHEVLNEAKIWLDRYFSGDKPSPGDIALSPNGSSFAKAVWQKLCRIPYGETTTYGKIAAEIAAQRGIKKMSARAVGGAVGRNPISIIVPCHRVIGSNGSLTGYAGGIDKKIALLHHEGAL